MSHPMSQIPEPFTPAECDLRGMEWMPLFGARLLSSDFFTTATNNELRAAIRLWWEAWHQVPAASLPDNDVILAGLAGYQTNPAHWKKLRRDVVLHGFVKCTDGRLYHPFLAEQALKAWGTDRAADRRTVDRDRLRRWRAARTTGNEAPPSVGNTGDTRGGTRRNTDRPRGNGRANASETPCDTSHETAGETRGATRPDATPLASLPPLAPSPPQTPLYPHTPLSHQHPHTPPLTPPGGGERRARECVDTATYHSTSSGGRRRARVTVDEAEFAEFYAAYPRQEAPDDARRAYRRARAEATQAEILVGLRRYVFPAAPEKRPFPAAWLRGGRWKGQAHTAPFSVVATPHAESRGERLRRELGLTGRMRQPGGPEPSARDYHGDYAEVLP